MKSLLLWWSRCREGHPDPHKARSYMIRTFCLHHTLVINFLVRNIGPSRPNPPLAIVIWPKRCRSSQIPCRQRLRSVISSIALRLRALHAAKRRKDVSSYLLPTHQTRLWKPDPYIPYLTVPFLLRLSFPSFDSTSLPHYSIFRISFHERPQYQAPPDYPPCRCLHPSLQLTSVYKTCPSTPFSSNAPSISRLVERLIN